MRTIFRYEATDPFVWYEHLRRLALITKLERNRFILRYKERERERDRDRERKKERKTETNKKK